MVPLVKQDAQCCSRCRALARWSCRVITTPRYPRSDLKKPWNQIRKVAELPDVHLHDLRRTFGLRVTRKAGLHVASKLLRHADVRVTEQVYSPLGLAELRKATEVQAKGLAKVFPIGQRKPKNGSRKGRGRAKVLPIAAREEKI